MPITSRATRSCRASARTCESRVSPSSCRPRRPPALPPERAAPQGPSAASCAFRSDHSRERQDPQLHSVGFDHSRARVFVGEGVQPVQAGDHVQTIAELVTTEHGGSHPEVSRDPDPARATRGLLDAGVRPILQPDVDVGRDRVRTLEHGGARADDQEADAERVECTKELDLSFGERDGGHGRAPGGASPPGFAGGSGERGTRRSRRARGAP